MSAGGRPRRALLATWLAAVLLAGCTGSDPETTGASPRPPAAVPPADQRLHFEWHEEAEVPRQVRDGVDVAREWEYAYYLWVTEPSTIPDYLEQHTGEELLYAIGTATGAPWTTGALRAVLVEVTTDDSQLRLGVCEDRRDRSIIDAQGQRLDDGGGISGVRIELSQLAAGGWLVDTHRSATESSEPELRQRCQQLATTPPPTNPAEAK